MLYEKFDDIKKLKRKQLKEVIISNSIPLHELQLSDLVFYNNKVIEDSIGAYFFIDSEKEIQYIGKNSSRCFIERIPSHFDLREGGWFNSFIKQYLKKIRKGKLTDLKFIKTIFQKFSLFIITFPTETNEDIIGKTESILRSSYMKPQLNFTKTTNWEKFYNQVKIDDLSLDIILQNDR